MRDNDEPMIQKFVILVILYQALATGMFLHTVKIRKFFPSSLYLEDYED